MEIGKFGTLIEIRACRYSVAAARAEKHGYLFEIDMLIMDLQ